MTLEALEQLIGPRPVIRHAGTVFYLELDAAEAERLGKLGATICPCGYAETFIAEVHVAGLLDFVGEPTEDEDEPVRDARPRIALERFRERDGYSWPARAEVAA